MTLNINSYNINLLKCNDYKRISKVNTSTKTLNNNNNNNNDDNKTSLNVNMRKQNNEKNNILENLQKQKQALIESKQALSTIDMDPKEKKYKLQEINENIQNVESQIQQFKLNEKEKEIEKKQEEMLKKQAKEKELKADEDEVREDIVISSSLNELIKFSHSVDNIHRLKDSKNRQLVEKNYIKHLTDLNGYTTPNNYNDKRLFQITKSISSLEHNVSKEINKINTVVKRIKYKTELENKKITLNEDQKNKDNNDTINNKDNKEKENIKEDIIVTKSHTINHIE